MELQVGRETKLVCQRGHDFWVIFCKLLAIFLAGIKGWGLGGEPTKDRKGLLAIDYLRWYRHVRGYLSRF